MQNETLTIHGDLTEVLEDHVESFMVIHVEVTTLIHVNAQLHTSHIAYLYEV